MTSAIDRLVECGFPRPGVHPVTGDPFVEADVRNETSRQIVHSPPPQRPGRWTCDYVDDDGAEVNSREMTDEEYAAAFEAYERAHAEWIRTGGVHVIRGQPLITGSFRTASGNEVRSILVGGQWVLEQAT